MHPEIAVQPGSIVLSWAPTPKLHIRNSNFPGVDKRDQERGRRREWLYSLLQNACMSRNKVHLLRNQNRARPGRIRNVKCAGLFNIFGPANQAAYTFTNYLLSIVYIFVTESDGVLLSSIVCIAAIRSDLLSNPILI